MVSGRLRGRGGTQHIGSLTSGKTATSCVAGPLCAGGVRRDPELRVFGSREERKEIVAG